MGCVWFLLLDLFLSFSNCVNPNKVSIICKWTEMHMAIQLDPQDKVQ